MPKFSQLVAGVFSLAFVGASIYTVIVKGPGIGTTVLMICAVIGLFTVAEQQD